MNGTPIDPAVLRLADEAGVLVGWVDAWGHERTVLQDDLLAVLAALTGRDLGSAALVDVALLSLVNSKADVEPVIVAWGGSLPATPVRAGVTDAYIALEDGTEVPVEITDGSVATREALPLGYHRLVIGGGSCTSHVFSAPLTAAPVPRDALGLLSPTYSLRSASHDQGIGTISELRRLADLCHDAGVQVVGTLPLLAAFPDEPSPYSPASRRAWNELFADFSAIPDWSQAGPVGTADTDWVDYEAVGTEIRSALARYSSHVSSMPRLRDHVDTFLRHEPEIRRYADFMATGDDHGRNWRAWGNSVEPDPARVAYHETVQWLMHTQLTRLSRRLRDRGQYLYLDLPIGCHVDGYDVWADPGLFAPASLGAPPDSLFVNGQDWGIPASVPSAARSDGHGNFRKAVAKQLSVAGLLRIDHVMGLLRTWWLPQGSDPRHGAYVKQPADEMFAIICIESVRADAGVVGENLGTVPPEITQGLVDHGLLAMAGSPNASRDPGPDDLVAVSSHDSPAFAAWWNAGDIDDLVDLGVFDEERAERERNARAASVARLQERFGTEGAESTRDALMEWMARSAAAIALVNLDDLLMEERRQNVPGTDTERPNWRLRHVRTIDDLASDVGFTESLRALSAKRHSDR